MIDRERLTKVADAMDALTELGIRSTVDVKTEEYTWNFWAWCPIGMEENLRRKVIAIMTRLVGKMEIQDSNWYGIKEGEIDAMAYQAQACKIVGYKKETKMVKKEIEHETKYEEVEEEVSIPVTDCDIKSGKFSLSDIEVTV